MVCTWPVSTRCLPDVVSPEDVARLDVAIDTAVLVLDTLTGQRYGCCPEVVRPCTSSCDGGCLCGGQGWYPVLLNGEWHNETCGSFPRCRRCGPGLVVLKGPVCAVTEVRIDGVVVPPIQYAVEQDHLYRIDAEWPSQNLGVLADQPGTFVVEYTRGIPAPVGADLMVGLLALEFWKACSGGKCRLPNRVVEVARAGTIMRMMDPSDLFERGITGISEVDYWIAGVNPYRHKSNHLVWSPEIG